MQEFSRLEFSCPALSFGMSFFVKWIYFIKFVRFVKIFFMFAWFYLAHEVSFSTICQAREPSEFPLGSRLVCWVTFF